MPSFTIWCMFTHPLAIRSLPPSSDDESSSEEEIIALDTTLFFCLELRPSSTLADFFELPFLLPFPSPRPFFSLGRPRSSPLLVFLDRDLPSDWRGLRSVLRFFTGGPEPSSPLPLPPPAPEPSVTKPSSSSFFLRPYKRIQTT